MATEKDWRPRQGSSPANDCNRLAASEGKTTPVEPKGEFSAPPSPAPSTRVLAWVLALLALAAVAAILLAGPNRICDGESPGGIARIAVCGK